jgi:hypothetical protein
MLAKICLDIKSHLKSLSFFSLVYVWYTQFLVVSILISILVAKRKTPRFSPQSGQLPLEAPLSGSACWCWGRRCEPASPLIWKIGRIPRTVLGCFYFCWGWVGFQLEWFFIYAHILYVCMYVYIYSIYSSGIWEIPYQCRFSWENRLQIKDCPAGHVS